MDLPVVQQKISKYLPHPIDMLLVCASFESRSLSFYDYLDPDNVSKTGVFYFKQFLDHSSANLDKLEKKFDAQKYEMDYKKPTTIADSLMAFLNEGRLPEKKQNIVIDISTFTRESLLIALKYMYLNRDRYERISLFYRFANVAENLSDGVESIRSVLGYIGDISINKPTHLILLSGFEVDRAREIIDTIEPDFISIGTGGKDSSLSSKLHALNSEFTKELVTYYADNNVEVFEHSLCEVNEVKNIILKLTADKPQHNTVLAPLNNKISTVGAGLAAFQNPEIQIIYSEMEEYNEAYYSTTEDDCIILELQELMERQKGAN